MKKLVLLSTTVLLMHGAMAQIVRGNSAHITCEPINTPGATIAVTEMANGKPLGTYSLVSNGKNQTEFRADLKMLHPKSSKLELLSGTTVVRTIPGPGPIGVSCDFENTVASVITLRPEEDWVWLAFAAGAFLVSCVDYVGESTTVTYDGDGHVISTTVTSGHWEWDCGVFGGMVVNVDGVDYHNITGLQMTSVVDGPVPAVNSLSIAANGGAKIKSIR